MYTIFKNLTIILIVSGAARKVIYPSGVNRISRLTEKSSGLVDVSQHLHLFPLSLWFDSILHSTLSITKPNVSRNR